MLLVGCAKTPPPELPAPTPARAVDAWPTDYPAAVLQAKAKHKKVLLYFTGSDWCVNCFRLDDEVFSKSEFTAYAQNHCELVQLDFPIHKELPEALTKQNEALQEKFQVQNLPTLVLLDADEHELAWIEGYRGEGVTGLIAELEHPAPLPTPTKTVATNPNSSAPMATPAAPTTTVGVPHPAGTSTSPGIQAN